jgi:hypothetical protein
LVPGETASAASVAESWVGSEEGKTLLHDKSTAKGINNLNFIDALQFCLLIARRCYHPSKIGAKRIAKFNLIFS